MTRGQRVELYLLRHADAGDPDAWDGPDAARPLSEKGKSQSERLASFLSGHRFAPDAIVSSPKVRATQTAEPLAAAIGMGVDIDDSLAGGFDLAALGRLLDARPLDRPVLVGHDPDFSELVETLCATPAVPLKKGALARVDADRPLRRGGGKLRWLVPPDLLAPRSPGG
jgi:phosphohistidine phosphatase SixA